MAHPLGYRRHQAVEQNLLRAGPDRNLVEPVVEIIVALELKPRGLPHLKQAIDWCIADLICVHAGDRRGLGVIRCREVGFARCQFDDVVAFCNQIADPCRGDLARRLV